MRLIEPEITMHTSEVWLQRATDPHAVRRAPFLREYSELIRVAFWLGIFFFGGGRFFFRLTLRKHLISFLQRSLCCLCR